MTPLEYIAQRYQETDRRPSWRVTMGPWNSGSGWIEILGIEEIEYTFRIGVVPTAFIRMRDPDNAITAWAEYFKDIRIEVGFDGVNLVAFYGKVFDVAHDQERREIQCQGSTWPLDAHFHELVQEFDGVDRDQALHNIFGNAKITRYTVDVSDETLGGVAPQTITFSTYGEAVTKVAELRGGVWMEFPSGETYVRDIRQLDKYHGADHALSYHRMDLDLLEEVQPDDTEGPARLISWRVNTRLKDVKNGCAVQGASYTVNEGEEDEDNISIAGSHEAPSDYVLAPDGSPAINDDLYESELIDTDAFAEVIAEERVNFQNGLPYDISAQVFGDPRLALSQIVRIIDPIKNFSMLGVLVGYTCRMTDNSFSSDLTLEYIDNADSANMKPYAGFSTTTVQLNMDDPEHFDAIMSVISECFDRDGFIDDGPLINDDDNRFPGTAPDSQRLNYADGTETEISIEVGDNDGAEDQTDRVVEYHVDAPRVFRPTLWVANGPHVSGSLNGGFGWDDTAIIGDSIICICPVPAVNSANAPTNAAYCGTQNGAIRRFTAGSGLVTVMTACGSPIVRIGGR